MVFSLIPLNQIINFCQRHGYTKGIACRHAPRKIIHMQKYVLRMQYNGITQKHTHRETIQKENDSEMQSREQLDLTVVEYEREWC